MGVAAGGKTYEPVIGLEIHVQLKTATKMFCPCPVEFGAPPNTNTCPVCLGLPGALPTVNRQAVRFALMIGLALGAELAPRSLFHRKNYFYPDLPKGYQISQYDEPLCRGGELERVRIQRVHLEEDAAKLIHLGGSGRIHGSDCSLVDFNRGGTPLVEIVTEPDLRSPEEAAQWLRLLRATLKALGVSDVNMEEGSLRADANISLRQLGSSALGTKTELKNLNSFRFLERGLAAEIARQEAILGEGGRVEQETVHYDPASGSLTVMRSKEEAHDYRYFPEPDLPPVAIGENLLAEAKAALGELPAARLRRYVEELGIAPHHAKTLAFRPALADYFEQALRADAAPPKALASWTVEELAPRLGEEEEPSASRAAADQFAALVGMVEQRQISTAAGRQVLAALVAEGGEAAQIVQARGLDALGEGEELRALVKAALEANPKAAEKVRAGEAKAIGPIVGHVMKASNGRADGAAVNRLIREALGV